MIEQLHLADRRCQCRRCSSKIRRSVSSAGMAGGGERHRGRSSAAQRAPDCARASVHSPGSTSAPPCKPKSTTLLGSSGSSGAGVAAKRPVKTVGMSVSTQTSRALYVVTEPLMHRVPAGRCPQDRCFWRPLIAIRAADDCGSLRLTVDAVAEGEPRFSWAGAFASKIFTSIRARSCGVSHSMRPGGVWTILLTISGGTPSVTASRAMIIVDATLPTVSEPCSDALWTPIKASAAINL